MKKNLVQAYKQAPWRTQFQWIGIFLLILVGVAIVAGVYLMISGEAAATGRHIQRLQNAIEMMELEINDLNTQYALASSAKSLSERVEALDMSLVDPQTAIYLVVPGYIPPSEPALAPPPSVDEISSPVLLPEFTASLWDWLRLRVFLEPSLPVETNQTQATAIAPSEVAP